MKSALQVIGEANYKQITEWVQLLDSLASDAEALAADEPHCAADQTSYSDKWCALGDRWFSLLWASMTPAFIAKSARRARDELRPVEVQLQDPLTDEQKRADTERAVAMNRPAPQIETPETEKPEPANWGDYSERKRAEREAAVIEQQERILAAAAAAEPEPAAEPQVDEVIELAVEPDPDELPAAWQPEPIEPELVWVRSDGLAAALNTSRSNVAGWNGKGLFAGLTRPPEAGEGKGQRFNLQRCRAAYEARPSRRNRNRPKPPAPMPVTIQEIEPLPPAVEPSAPEADAAALLELAGGDEATLAALRVLLLVPSG
jgi:hypothetical protein